MKNADEMTADELESLAKQKREQENKPIKEDKIIKEGFLNCDLYILNCKDIFWGYANNQYVSKEELDKLREQLGTFVLPKGTRFIKYDLTGWYDENEAYVEEAGDIFANLHLENIKDINNV